MSTPLNPAIKPGTLTLGGKFDSPKKSVRKAPRELARLSMPESHALITWLMNYKMQPGDSVVTLATYASVGLNNPKINYNHVRQRMEEFGLELPKRASNAPVIERLTKLEKVLTVLIREQARMLHDLGQEPSAEVMAFLDE